MTASKNPKGLTFYQAQVLKRIRFAQFYPLTIWLDESTQRGRRTEWMHNAGVTPHMVAVLERKGAIRLDAWPQPPEKRGRRTYRAYKIVVPMEREE